MLKNLVKLICKAKELIKKYGFTKVQNAYNQIESGYIGKKMFVAHICPLCGFETVYTSRSRLNIVDEKLYWVEENLKNGKLLCGFCKEGEISK